jgi:hypothetical protein
MSLAIFKTELVPSPGLRKLVLISGVAALLAGTAIVLYLPLPLVGRGAICAIWIIDCVRELTRVARGNARVSRLQLDANGDIFSTRPDGRRESLILQSGSVVLSRLAWLRLRFPDGSVGAELMSGDPLRDPRWQRLQLIWQQSRSAFATKTDV